MSDRWAVHLGDCREVMEAMEPESIDSIVSDPPYGLSFMGKGWDHGVPGVEFWQAALRVAKPGAHLLAFGGTRTFHRLAVAIEDAGWEIRDCVMWVYAQGFPKSHDVSKAIDREAGAEREVVGRNKHGRTQSVGAYNFGGRDVINGSNNMGQEFDITAPATDAAQQWQGWGTALKPAYEPIIVARKPLRGTVAGNVLEWGTGGINVDGCRIDGAKRTPGYCNPQSRMDTSSEWNQSSLGIRREVDTSLGRWPANFIHDGSEEVTDLLGDAARFFYCPKASKRDRDEGCEANHHPTVKPTDLMRYLCRLVTQPDGLVFDPFTGSGSTGKAAMLEGFRFVGCELSAEYIEIARARIGHAAGRERQMELALA